MMQTLKRRGLLILTNIAIIAMISIIMFVLEQYFGVQIQTGNNIGLLIFAALFGFGGAIVNLWMSRRIARMAYKLKNIDQTTSDTQLRVVYDEVSRLATEHNITMPQVAYFESAQPNAFATGPTKNKSLVAVSTGLLELMPEDQVRAVVGHEMAHVLNGDMVTMTLLQGVLNTFVIFISRMLARVVSAFVDERLSILAYYGIVFAFDMILGLLASLVLMRFSRHREYHADAGAAQFMGSPIAMIGALRSLEKAFAARQYEVKENAVFHLMIFGEAKKRLRSHPTTEQRIRALESGQYSSGV